jgi:hypothetical protein
MIFVCFSLIASSKNYFENAARNAFKGSKLVPKNEVLLFMIRDLIPALHHHNKCTTTPHLW